jgi:hypothetical protein
MSGRRSTSKSVTVPISLNLTRILLSPSPVCTDKVRGRMPRRAKLDPGRRSCEKIAFDHFS